MEIQNLKHKCRIFNWGDNYEDEKVIDIPVNGNISNNVIVFIVNEKYYCYDLEELIRLIKIELDKPEVDEETNEKIQYIQGEKIDNEHYYIDRGNDNNGFRIYENNYIEYEGIKDRVLQSFQNIFNCVYKLDDFIYNIIIKKRNTFMVTTDCKSYIVGNNRLGNECTDMKIYKLIHVDRSIITLDIDELTNYSICPVKKDEFKQYKEEFENIFKKLDIYKQSFFYFELEKYKYKDFVFDENNEYKDDGSDMSDDDLKNFQIANMYFQKFQSELGLMFRRYISKLLRKKYIAILEGFTPKEFKDVENEDENDVVDITLFNRTVGAHYDRQMRNNEIEDECVICHDSLYPENEEDRKELYTAMCCGKTFHLVCLNRNECNRCVLCRGQIFVEIVRELDYSDTNLTVIPDLTIHPNLTTLNLSGNNNLSDISSLATLTNLTYLDLSFNNISDISSLSFLTNLTTLGISKNNISDLTPLRPLTNLTELYLDNNDELSDISSLSFLTNLTTLKLSGNESLSDISSLSSLINLTTLYLDNNFDLSDISSLSSLINLTILDLSFNQHLSDISSLSSLINLTYLNLSYNQHLSDISSLYSLINLTTLKLADTNISDVSSLYYLVNTLLYIDLSYNNISEENIQNLIHLLPNTNIYFE